MQKEWGGGVGNAPSNMASFEQNLVTIHSAKLLKPHTMRVTLKHLQQKMMENSTPFSVDLYFCSYASRFYR